MKMVYLDEVLQTSNLSNITHEGLPTLRKHVNKLYEESGWQSRDNCTDYVWIFTLPKTNIAPENGWLEDYFPFGFRPIFKCELLVLWRVMIPVVPHKAVAEVSKRGKL